MARLAWPSEPLFIILKFLIISSALLTSNFIEAGPTGQRSALQCASFCKEAKNFLFEPGTTYVYDYVTDVETRLLQTSHQKSQVRVGARVELEAVSSCDIKIQLKNVNFQDLTQAQYEDEERLTDNDNDNSALFREQKEKLERNSLVFGFQDGKIEDICANDRDEIWVVNVKRGIVSAIQNSMEDLSLSGFVHETDVSGRCPTEYILDGEAWAGGVTYKKIKDLTKCTSRQTQLSAVQSVPYSSSSPIQNIPLLRGKVECTQTVRNKKVEHVLCQEEQRFQAFEGEESGAITSVTQSLAYLSEHSSPRFFEDMSGYVKKSLLFEEEEPLDGSEDNAKELLNYLDRLDKASFPQVSENAPQLFTQFIEQLRESSESSLKTVYGQVRETKLQKYLMEALPVVGTASSLAFLRDLTMEKGLEKVHMKNWLSTLAFIKHPSLDMLKAVAPLIYDDDASMEAILGVSSLVNSYCRYHKQCNHDVIINEILETLVSYLGNSCRIPHPHSSAESTRRMVLRLKAIGNAGILPMSQEVTKVPVIVRCFEEKINPTEVRLAAIDSLRRMSCGSYDSKSLFTTFANPNENTEVRIKAFLTTMRCTNRHTLELVKSVLYTESVNQVASFVWTYLTNLQETNRPEKQELRDLLSNEFLKNKFNTDARKFSRNFESSTFWEDYNLGAGLDSNIIFTEESFLPKSGMLNLTLQLFGESVNVMEFGLRSHGMEQLLEKVFGPEGLLPDNRVRDFLHSSRQKRSTSSSSSDNKDGLNYLYDQAKQDDDILPGGSFYTRMFGHEVMYKNFEISDKSPIPNVVDEIGESWFSIRHVLDNLSTGKKSEFSKSMVLLDTSFSVPTISGFPLDLGVHATSTMALIAKGRFNVARFMETKELDIHGTLKPSAMINVDGTLAVRFGSVGSKLKTGLKLHNKLRSSTAVEANLLVKGKNVLHASINVPQDKHEIVDVSSELLLLQPSGESPVFPAESTEVDNLQTTTAYISNGCSSPYISQITGMKVCMEMFIPTRFSFTPLRPTFFKVYMEKVDDFEGYTIDYRYDSDEFATKLSCVFDTPGSNVNRRIATDFLFDKGMGKIAAGLESTSTALRAEGIYTQFQKNLELSLVSHEKTSFLLSLGLRSDGNVMKPHFLITWHSQPIVDLKGTIDMTPQSNNENKIAITMNLKHLTETPVKVVGEIVGSGEQREASLSIESYILTGNVRSILKRKTGHWSTKTTMEYSWKRDAVHTADLSAKIQRSRKGALGKLQINAGFSSTQFPDNSLDFQWETQTSLGFCENRMRAGWGKTRWEGHTLFSRQHSSDHSDLRLESSLLCSKFDIDYRFEFANTLTTEGLSTKLLSRLGTDNELNANLEYVSAVDDLLRKTLEAQAIWPSTEYTFKASFIEKQRGDFEAELLVNLNNTRELKATALYMNRSNNLKLEHNIEFRARGFTSVPLAGSISFSATEKQSHIGCQVQLEGKKQSRMSVSVDYSHTKHSHKVEAKVTLNERKYNGEVLYMTQGSMKNITVDLQLESHIYLEAALNGMLPDPMLASFLIVPDKDREPNSKLRIEGDMDTNSLSLALDYFGEEFGAIGRYDEDGGGVMFEALWPQDNKMMISVAVPHFSLGSAQVLVDITTPFQGYSSLSLTAEHAFVSQNLKTIVIGSKEDTMVNAGVVASVASREINIATELAVTGYDKLEANLLILRKTKRKSFQVKMKKGESESLLDFDLIQLDEGHVGKFNFHGCSFLPKITLEVNHQFSSSRPSSYHATVEWVSDQNEAQKMVIHVTHENYPLNVALTLTTPWTPFKTVETSLFWDSYNKTRQIKLTSKNDDDNDETISIRLQLEAKGDLLDFTNELDLEWFSHPLRITISGGLNGTLDSNMHAVVNMPSHSQHISFDLLSKKDVDKYVGEFRADMNKAVTSAGIKWDFSGEVQQEKVIALWGQIPRYAPIQANLEYDKRSLKMKVERKGEPVIDLMSTWQISGVKSWTSELVLRSTLGVIPSISFSSTHDMSDLTQIKHESSLRLIPTNEEYFWMDRYFQARHASLKVSVENLEDVKGTLILGGADYVIDGKIQNEGESYVSKVKISSNQFHELHFDGAYTNQESSLQATGRLYRHDGETVVHVQLEGKNLDLEKMGKFKFASILTPTLEGEVLLELGAKKTFSASILKNSENVMAFSWEGSMSRQEGTVRVKLTSELFQSISLLQLDLDYVVSAGETKGILRFQDNGKTHQLKMEYGTDDDEMKMLSLGYEGLSSYSFECKVQGLSQLVATAVHNGDKLGELIVQYRPEHGDYSLGKHRLHVSFERGILYDFSFVVGLDPRKIFVNVLTPFENWTDIVVDGQIGSTAISKGIKFVLQREGDKIQGSFESKNSRKTGTLTLSSELTVVGFSTLRQILLETAKATKIQGLSAVNPQKFTAQLMWASTSFNVKLDTPVDALRKLVLSGHWDLKNSKKFLSVTGALNEKNFDLKTEIHHDQENCMGKFQVTSDFAYGLDLGYDFRNNYQLSLAVETPNRQWNIGGKINVQESSLSLELITPVTNFESVVVSMSREIEIQKKKGVYRLAWDINGNADEVKLNYDIDQGRIELRAVTPVKPWNSIVVTIIYDTPFKRLTFYSQRGDGQEIKLNFEMDTKGKMTSFENPASSNILVAIETPVEQFRDIRFSLLYDRKNFVHMANISISRNDEETEGKLNLLFRHSDPVNLDISAHLSSPVLSSKATAHASLLVDPSGESTVSAHVQANGKRYEMFGSSQLTNVVTKFEMRTSLPFLRQFKFALKKGTTVNLYGLWNGNSKEVEVHGDLLCGGLKSSRINFNVSTPVDIMGSFGFEGEVMTNQGGSSALLIFQNHEVRWLAKLERQHSPSVEDWRVQVNTPLQGYKHVVASLKHSNTPRERYILGVVQLNQKELSLRSNLQLQQKKLVMILQSELSYLPIQAKLDSDWGNNLNLKVSMNTGNHEYGTAFSLDLVGVSNGKFNFAISSIDHLDTKLDWKFEGDSRQGQGVVNVKNKMIGSKSLRSSWRNEDWEEVRADLWVKTGSELEEEKGITLKYKVTPHENYGEILATANYTFGEDHSKSIVFEASIDEQSSNVIFDTVLRTPFDDLEEFKAQGQIKMKNEIGFILDATLNEERLIKGSFNLSATPLEGRIKIELDIPLVTDPLLFGAIYDMTKEKKIISVNYNQNTYKMDLNLVVTLPHDSNLVDVNLTADSNVPTLNLDVNGRLRVEYAISSDGTRQVSFHLDGNDFGDWKLLASIRPFADFHSKVIFEGPFEPLPSLMAEMALKGSLREQINGTFVVILEKSEVYLSLMASNTMVDGSFRYDFRDWHHSAKVLVDLSAEEKTLEASYDDGMNYRIGANGKLLFTPESKKGSGVVKVTTGGNEEIPVSFEVAIDHNGNILIAGSSQQSNIRIEGDLKGLNGKSWWDEGLSVIKMEGVFTPTEMTLETRHFIRGNEYSINGSLGLFNVDFYVRTGEEAVLYSNWEREGWNGMKLDVKLSSSNVDAYVDLPPLTNIHLLGDYGSSANSAFVNGVLLVNGQRSNLNASLVKNGDETKCKALLENPSVKQKLDLEIVTVIHAPQNLEGQVKMKVNEHDIRISGGLKTHVFNSTYGDTYIERTLQLSSNITTFELSSVGLELFFRKPLKQYASLHVEGTLNVNEDISTLTGGYMLPSFESGGAMGIYSKLDSSYLTTGENYEFFLKSFGKGLKKIEGKLNYRLSKFDVIWDFYTPTSVVSFSYGGRSDDGDPLLFQIESIFNSGENLQLSINCQGWDTHYVFKTSMTRSPSAVVGYLFIDAPRLLSTVNEYKVTVTTNEDGSYTLESSLLRGRLVMELIGDAKISSSNLNVILKAMGSYGSHYAMITGSKGDGDAGKYIFELTAESSSLLAGKRLNVRGNVTVEGKVISTVLQCRARRNIHEISVTLQRMDGGNGKLVVNVDSPSLEAGKMEAEWMSKGKVHSGKLHINLFNQIHQSDFGLNLDDFEGKLHILSPFLPSEEFNFHLKSIVNSRNIDLLGDIQIRGSHWRLEAISAFVDVRDMTFKIEARTPFQFMDRVTLGVKSTKEELYMEVYTPVTYVPNVMLSLGGMQKWEGGRWYELKPNLVISLPDGKYGATASLEMPGWETSGALHFLLLHTGKETKTLEAYAEISPLNQFQLQMEEPGHLELRLITPFKCLHQAKLRLEGEINMKRSGKLQMTGALNTHEAKFDASFDNTNGNMQAVTRLITNIPHYEKSAFAIAIETFQGIGNGKSFHVEFRKPDWDNLFRLDADYRYKFESFTELEGEVNMNMDSYMNLPPLHAHVKSGMKNGRYGGALEGNFGVHRPSLKVETENVQGRLTVFVEGKAGERDRYKVMNIFEMIPMQNDFSFRENLHWNGSKVVDMELALMDSEKLAVAHLHMITPWGPVNSKAALTPITLLTMEEDVSLSQLLKNSNATLDVRFNDEKLVGLEIVSRNGMRVFEVHNPIRPVSISVAVEKVEWNSVRLKAGVCWDLKVPQKSSLGLDGYVYRKSTGLTIGGYIAAARYGIVSGKFEHFLISSRLAQNVEIGWNGFAGRTGSMGYIFNITKRSLGFKRQVDYGLQLNSPFRSVLISGGSSFSDEKYTIHNMAISWDLIRDPKKVVEFNVSTVRTTTWRTVYLRHSLEFRHFSLAEPLIFLVEKTIVHDSLKQVDLKIKPSSNPSSHLTIQSSWDDRDWSSFTAGVMHPSSKINIQGKYNITETTKFLRLTHMLSTGEMKMFTANLERKEDSQQVIIQTGDVDQPRTISSFSMQCNNNNGEHTVKGNLFSYQLQGTLRTSLLPYLDLMLMHENSRKLHVLCGLPHPKEIVFKTSRSHYSKTFTDVSFLVRLNSSNLLSTRIHWRPEVMDEIQDYDWLKGTRSLLGDVFPSFNDLSSAIRQDVEGHWELFSPQVRGFLREMYRSSEAELAKILEELDGVYQGLREMYQSNQYYIKDIVDLLMESLSPLQAIVESAVQKMKEACKTVCYYVMNATQIISNGLVKYYGRLESHIMTAWENLEERIIHLWKNNADWLQNCSEELEEMIDALIEALEGRIELLEKKLMAVGFIKNVIRLYQEYATWLDELPIDDYMSAIENFFQIKVWNRLEEMFGRYFEVVGNALNGDYIKELLETPPIPYIRFMLKQVKNAVVRLWDLIELEVKVKELVRHALKNVDVLMQRNFPSWELDWDLDRGVIEYDQSLSILEWANFTQLPRWKLQSEEKEQVNQITNLYYQICDYIENLKPFFDMRIRDILPPFGGLAMMAGDYHYYTFDRKYFRFAGECSYVLVADLLHNGFSFIVNYETRDGTMRKKSYSIATKESMIEIDTQNFKVTVDSRKVELPVKVGTTYVRRQETRLDVYDTRGYQISCTLSPSVCTFTTSGWYYGKLGGLLGTYDNENINDFRSPDGQIISDVPTFAYSWRVGKNRNQCRMKNFAKDDADAESVDVDNICYDLLGNRNSPLRPCFNTVDTKIFMEMCKYDVSKNMNSASRSESACTSMSAYVTECQKHNVDVWMPPTCVRCKLEDGTALTTGENATLEVTGEKQPPSSSDVVILLEEKECMDQLDLSLAVLKLEAALKAEGIFDNRYAVVGFGGEEIHYDPHIQTSYSSVWSHSTLFKAPETQQMMNVNSTKMRKTDLYSAIHFASTMTYRAGVAKTLIAITCGDDDCGDSVRYADTLTLLVENDFRLHILTPKPFTLKGNKKLDESNRILGVDANGVYTAHHAKRVPLEPDTSYKRHLNLPKDLCTPLAIETNGTRFTSENLSKKELDVWARRVSRTSHPSECQRCECVPDKNGGSRLMCHQCVSPSLWKFLEEWKNYQDQEEEDVFGIEILDSEPFLLPPN